MNRIGLALGSGGANGLSHRAFIKALDEMKITPSVSAGSSIGAVVGAFTAAGMTDADMLKHALDNRMIRRLSFS